MRLPGPDGSLMHACLTIGSSQLFLVDENVGCGVLGPKSLKGSAVTIHLQVEDADAAFAQAVAAGAAVKMPIEDTFWGDRFGQLEDPFGQSWSVAAHVRDVSPEDTASALQQAFAKQP